MLTLVIVVVCLIASTIVLAFVAFSELSALRLERQARRRWQQKELAEVMDEHPVMTEQEYAALERQRSP